MDAAEWEQQFEERIARERALMIDLLDAARALQGTFRPAGPGKPDAAQAFRERFEAWQEAADGVARSAQNYLARR